MGEAGAGGTGARGAGSGGPTVVFGRLPLAERSRLLEALREETVGGALLLGAAVLALVWANSPWRESYHHLAALEVGPAALQLHLPLEVWAADGLLAVFFFVAGLELKHELVVGTLSRPSRAVVPVVAALSGMVVPAVLYVVTVRALGDPGAAVGWGIPMATDIAFALAVLAVLGARLPVALRAFLLTLAVVDDLGAILVIAVFYSHGFAPLPFVLAVVGLAAYWVLQRRRVRSPVLYVALALVVWALMHASGIHATVAGVAIGLLTRVRPDPGETEAPADRYEHAVRPLSAGVCVPLFAFFSAGVTFVGLGGSAITEPVAVAVVVGLVLGKPVGIYGGARLVARFTRATLSSSLRWADVLAVGVLAGIGFTVSLLIDELAFPGDPALTTAAKIGVLLASVVATLLASVALAFRRRAYAALAAEEERDEDGDGVPDVYGSGANSPGSR